VCVRLGPYWAPDIQLGRPEYEFQAVAKSLERCGSLGTADGRNAKGG
jgi:hypothetical protein